MISASLGFNMVVLTEAFGSGPPYYSRTTNMDKWSNPFPWLVPFNAIFVFAALVILRASRGRSG
jgi:hypothetical protein